MAARLSGVRIPLPPLSPRCSSATARRSRLDERKRASPRYSVSASGLHLAANFVQVPFDCKQWRGYSETKSAIIPIIIMYYVYLLTCSDDKTYIGCTEDLKARIERHNKGFVPATQNRLPVKLIAYFAFRDK